jgi:hypothetical protein
MKSLYLSGMLLVLCSLAIGGEAASVQFDGSTYRLASVNVAADGVITNDYVKEGETLESHKTLLSVRHFPKAESINQVINPWLQSVRAQLTKKWSAMQTPNGTGESDVTVEAWISTGGSQVDATLQRFFPSDTGGILAYRFVDKFDPSEPGAKEKFAERKYARMEALGGLKLQPAKEKP